MATLVTGAAGFIGSTLVDRLLEEGRDVVGLDSFDSSYPRAVKEANLHRARDFDSFRIIEGDVRDEAVLDALPPGVDQVVHLAARGGVRPSIEDPRLYSSVNVDGTMAVLEWMRRRALRDLIFASSSSVYGNNAKVPFAEIDAVDAPISPYAATKRSAELLCHTYHHLFGVSVYALRFFTAYGARQRPDLAIHKFACLLSSGQSIPMFGDGSTARDYTFVGDVVDGVTRALETISNSGPDFLLVNLGFGQPIELREMIRVLGEEMGVEPDIERLPMQPGDVLNTFADIGVARKLIGYEPTTDLRTGIRHFLQWFESTRATG